MSVVTGARVHSGMNPALLALAALFSAFLGLVVGFNTDVAVLVAGAALAPLLFWCHPSWTLVFMAVAVGFNVDLIRVPFHVSLPQVVALAMVVGVALRPATLGLARKNGAWAWGGLLFAVVALPSVPGSVVPRSAVAGLIQLAVAGLVMFAASDWLRSRPQTVRILGPLLVLGAVLSVVPAIVQVVFTIGPDDYVRDGLMRAYSTYRQPNPYGLYLVGVSPLALVLLKRHRLYALAFCVLCLGIVLTGSRGAWVAFVGAMAALYLITSRVSGSTVLVGLVGVGVLAASPFWLPEQYLARFTLDNWSTQQRLLLLLMSWQGIVRNPFLGYGSGSFTALMPDIAMAGYVDDVEHPHNLFLHVWLELGLAPLVVLVLLLAAYFWVTLRAYRANRDPLLAAVVAGVTGMLLGSMFGTLMVRGITDLFVLLIAMSGALVALGASSHKSAPDDLGGEPRGAARLRDPTARI